MERKETLVPKNLVPMNHKNLLTVRRKNTTIMLYFDDAVIDKLLEAAASHEFVTLGALKATIKPIRKNNTTALHRSKRTSKAVSVIKIK